MLQHKLLADGEMAGEWKIEHFDGDSWPIELCNRESSYLNDNEWGQGKRQAESLLFSC